MYKFICLYVVQEALEELPEVDEAEIRRSFPSTVTITINEHPRVAYLYNDNYYYPILANGLFLSPLPDQDYPSDAPILVEWQEGEALTEMAAQLEESSEQLVERISEIFFTPTDSNPLAVTLYMNDGFEVHTTIREFAERMTPYSSIVQEIEPGRRGILHMRMSPYFEEFNEAGEEVEIEGEG